MKLKIDIDQMLKDLREHQLILLLISDNYVESIRDPLDEEHVALNAQLQVAAEGNHHTYIFWLGKPNRGNLNIVLDMLEGADLKGIFFADKEDEEDLNRATLLLQVLMGPASLGNKSGDYVKEIHKRNP